MPLPYRHVLVPLDGSVAAERAVRPALELAHRLGVAVTFLTRAGAPDADDRNLYLDGVARLHAGEVDIDTVVVDSESLADAITSVSPAHTLVCMTSHGHGRAAAVLGSVAEEVLRELGAPVLVVGPHVPESTWMGNGRIVTCLDGSTIAAAALPPAAALSRALGMPLWLVAVAEPGTRATDVFESAPLAIAARQVGGVEGWDVLHDRQPAKALAALDDHMPVSLLVMTTHGRTGWRRLTLGSVTASTVHAATVPVLVVPAVTQAAQVLVS